MTCYVDPCAHRGWVLRGRATKNCHLFTDGPLEELHEMAERIGMKRSWFQDHETLPHYDLTERRRLMAVHFGAVEVDKRELVRAIRARRLLP